MNSVKKALADLFTELTVYMEKVWQLIIDKINEMGGMEKTSYNIIIGIFACILFHLSKKLWIKIRHKEKECPASKEDLNDAVKKMQTAPSAQSPPKELSNILPRRKEEDIVGRHAQLRDLRARLADKNQVLVMNGMGGIGKTTLAAVYINTYYDDYQHILWVDSNGSNYMQNMAGTEGLLENLKIPKGNPIEETYGEIIRKLKALPGKNLLVIDNARGNLAEYKDSLPAPPDWHILVTSRETLDFFDIMALDFLNQKDTIALFKRYYKRNALSQAFIERLVEKTGYHTLTLEILAKTAQHARLSEKQIDTAITDDRAADVAIPHRGIKIERIRFYLSNTFDLSNLSNDETILLRYIALLPNIDLPYTHLEKLVSHFIEALPKRLSNLSQKGWLIENETRDTYRLHQIAAEVVRHKKEYQENFIAPLRDSLRQLLSLDEYDNPVDRFIWAPYGRFFLQCLADKNWFSLSGLQNNLAVVLKYLGELNVAKSLLKKVLKSAEKNFGEDHPKTAKCYSNLAVVLRDLGELNAARSLLEKALKSAEKNFGEDHPKTAKYYSNLAVVLQDLDELNAARSLLEKALKSAEKNLGEDHPDTAISCSNLALVLKDLGELNAAKSLLEKALKSAKKNLGEDHPDTAIYYSNLAVVLQDLGELNAARSLLENVLKSDEKNLGEDHLEMAKRYSNLALVLKDLGELNAARSLLEKALKSAEKNLGEDHPDTAIYYSNLALVLKDLGELDQANSFLEKAYTVFYDKFGDTHPHTKTAKRHLDALAR